MGTPKLKASCDLDGEVTLWPTDLTLLTCSNKLSLSYYVFTCPRCREDQRKGADALLRETLRSAGVTETIWTVPGEALESHDGPALTHDDLIDFGLALRSADLHAELDAA